MALSVVDLTADAESRNLESDGMCFVMKDRDWFSADRKLVQVTQLLLFGSYNLASHVDDLGQPSSVFNWQISMPGYYVKREKALKKT